MILRGLANIKEEAGDKCHGGTGKFSVRTLLEKEFESNLAYVRELVLHPQSSIGIHEHAGDEEIYYIVSGEGIMVVDDEREKVVPGDVILTKSGSRHGLINESDRDLKIFVVCSNL